VTSERAPDATEPEASDRIPLGVVDIGAEEEERVLRVLRSGQLAQGPAVEELEARMREWCGVRHAVALSSGTAALLGALRALGVGAGDEVVTSPFTFVATLNAILAVGATARFADIDPRDFTLEPDSVASRITPRTRVLLPVHLYGQPAAMDAIGALARAHDITIVEDAAQAHGAAVGERSVGSYGVGCFSFYATKNVTTGEGGMVTTDDDAVAQRLLVLRNQGMRARYDYEVPGHNWRLTDLQAAVGVPQVARLASTIAARQRNAARLSEGLGSLSGVVVPAVRAGHTHVFHQYTIRVTPDAPCDRDTLAARLDDRGIATGVYYPRLVHDYDCYRGHPQVTVDHTPRALTATREVLSLPVHTRLRDRDIDLIVSAVHRSVAGEAPL